MSRVPARFLSIGMIMLATLASPSIPTVAARSLQASALRTIYVNVVDQSDRPVRDLAATAFMVREDNVIREIAEVKPATEPMSIAILVDTTPEALYAIKELRAAILSFVRAILAANPASQISIG